MSRPPPDTAGRLTSGPRLPRPPASSPSLPPTRRPEGSPVPAKRAIVGALLALVTAAGLAAPAAGQGVEAAVDSVGQRLEAARSRQLHLIAPRHFSRAAEKLSEARRRLESGGSISEIRQRLSEARTALSRAEELEEVGSVLLRDALAAREDALAANATEHAPELWDEAASKLAEAGRAVEDGDQNEAREDAEEARARFRKAELRAIERSLLGQAREARRRARERDADERAPQTYARADSLLGAAESLLQRDPDSQAKAGSLAEESARQFRHALHISALADTFDRDGGIEDLLLRAEDQLARVARQLEFDPRFTEGLAPATDEVLSAVRSLQEDRAGLQERVKELQDDLAAERGRVDSLEQELARLGEQRQEVAAELQERQQELRERRRREEKMREIRAVFSEEEAEVLMRGDDLIVRLVGITFPSASAEVRPENYSLLTKLQRVIREFPDASITVNGHTDSRGNAEYNQSLSQRRAIAVREYLLANMALSADRISARGHGESQPIATNDTEEGRALNRRIDVVLDLPED